MDYNNEWINDKCDRYDYLISVFSGVVSGFVDVFFVGTPGESVLGNFTDSQTDKLVKKFARSVGWNPRDGKEESIKSAIGFLEKKFYVNYDQPHREAVGGAFDMAAKNHHFKSLSHCPDIVGLFFSILDQFQGKSSFIADGSLIRIDTETQSLYGSNLISKLFSGFYNWLGHIMSDIAGSSGGRGNLSQNRGSGVPIPFMELFQFCDFGQFGKNRQTLAEIMVGVFQKGYDLRFGIAMSIPVVLNELLIRALWVIKKRFFEKREWKESIPTEKHSDLRMMLIVGYATFCVIDGTDAFIRSGGNIVLFILRLNIIGWFRFILLVLKEIWIRYGGKIRKIISSFLNEIKEILSYGEYKVINEYNKRIAEFDEKISVLFNEFVTNINKEYLLLHKELELSFAEKLSFQEQAYHSERVAGLCGVKENKIIRTEKDLEDFFIE